MYFFINNNILLWNHLWIFKSTDSFAIPILISFFIIKLQQLFLLSLKILFMQISVVWHFSCLHLNVYFIYIYLYFFYLPIHKCITTILSAILSAFIFSPLLFSIYNSQCAQVYAVHALSLSLKSLALVNAVLPSLPSRLLCQEFLENF